MTDVKLESEIANLKVHAEMDRNRILHLEETGRDLAQRIEKAREILEPHKFNPDSNILARVVRDALAALEGK